MRTSDFYYELPQELIAQDPLEDRSSLVKCRPAVGAAAEPSFFA